MNASASSPPLRILWIAWVVGGLLLVGCRSSPAPRGDWQYEDGVRWASLAEAQGNGPGFRQLDSSRTGLAFTNTVTKDMIAQNRNMLHGSGVAVGDVNGDDWPDLFLTQLGGPNRLYLNQGNFEFREAAGAGGAALEDSRSTGASLVDLTGDGALDLVVTTMGGANVVFHNDGSGRFRRIDDAGLHSGQGSTTSALADVNGDGALDLYVANYKRIALRDSLPPSTMRFKNLARQVGPGEYEVRPEYDGMFEIEMVEGEAFVREKAERDRLYLNDGDGTFTERAWANAFRTADGEPMTEVPRSWALVARLEDLNGDGHPDLYVCNDYASSDLLFWGTAEDHFVEAEPSVLRTTSHATMSIATSDFNRDGHTDFFLTDMLGRGYERRQSQMPSQVPRPHAVDASRERVQEMQNTLQVNRGDATFAQVAGLAGVEATGWTWASRFLDVDLDGYEDLLAATGHAYDVQDPDARRRTARLESQMQSPEEKLRLIFEYPRLDLPNAAFRNQGDGTFEWMPEGWGLGTTDDLGHGLATGDFDRDGDLDVIINRLNRSLGVYENQATASRVAIRLVGRAPNTEAVGATVTLRPERAAEDSLPAQTDRVISGGEYLSDSESVLSFAMGTMDRARVDVAWPNGDTSRVPVRPNRIYEIPAPGAEVDWPSSSTAPSDSSIDSSRRAARSPRPDSSGAQRTNAGFRFEDVRQRLDHTHADEKYVDFQRQPLLQRRLSQQGPGAAWADLDGDGDDDLLLGTGRGGELAYFRNDEGTFERVRGGVLEQTFERDLTGLVAAPDSGGATVFVARSNYERSPDDPARPSSIFVLDAGPDGLQPRDTLRVPSASVGPLALADVNGDGALDLFAGGRHVPGNYPADASSVLFVNDDGTYTAPRSLSRPLEDVGLVSGATFADLDGDGDPDLLLTTEWGPIRYFENQGGRLREQTAKLGLDRFSGFWRGVGVGDFNEDGRLDFVATNWGWNSKYGRPPGPLDAPDSPQLAHPLRVYYDQSNQGRPMGLLETKYHADRDGYLPYQGLPAIARGLPHVQDRMSSFEEFSTASLEEVVGSRWLDRADTKEANTLSHMVFLNTDDGFTGHALPRWAQLSTGFSPSVADLNGDGHLDLLLSQNFFATESETPRQDAGRALVLRGDGTGHFAPVKGHRSGITVYGEQRAAPVADVDRDGRVDLLITQHGASTTLFRNVGATPGLRVQLNGPTANPSGIGATVRLHYEDDGRGPALPVTAGSGYWSQHSLTPVLGHGSQTVTAVEVRWPDGTTSEADVSPGAQSVTVSYP